MTSAANRKVSEMQSCLSNLAQHVLEVQAEVDLQTKENKKLFAKACFLDTIRANLLNREMSDADFRKFVANAPESTL